MAKNIKLDTKKKSEADGTFYIKGGFFHRFTVTRTTNVVVMILQVLSLAATAIFALFLGILGSLATMAEGYEGMMSTVAGYIETAVLLWLISSIVYVVGTIVLFLGFSRIAAGIHTEALMMSLVVYYIFDLAKQAGNLDTLGPVVLYMPCIFIAIISIVIAAVVNVPLWLDKKEEKDREIAPSILAEDEQED